MGENDPVITDRNKRKSRCVAGKGLAGKSQRSVESHLLTMDLQEDLLEPSENPF
jgi:hypothetical protein